MKIRIVVYTLLVYSIFFSCITIASEQQSMQNDESIGNMSQSTTLPKTSQKAVKKRETVSQNDINELNTMSDPKSVPDASDDMDDWFDSVLESFHIDHFGENNGMFIFAASQSVSLKPIDPQYGDALVNAFDKAMQRVQEKYLMVRYGMITTEKIRSFFSDRSTHAKDIPLPSVEKSDYTRRLLSITDKGLSVIEKKLDRYLIRLGADPKELV